jgi:hypothetical protein
MRNINKLDPRYLAVEVFSMQDQEKTPKAPSTLPRTRLQDTCNTENMGIWFMVQVTGQAV